MKILMLSNSVSSHTNKWVKSLTEEGCEIFLFSLSKDDQNLYEKIPLAGYVEMELYHKEKDFPKQAGKYKYLKALPIIKGIIKEFKPDILHAHYISSYGLLGALARFHPYVLSVWGSDIFEVPRQSFFHRVILKFALKKADVILSTSHCMKEETNKYTMKNIEVTPFGIDTEQFKPLQPVGKMFDDNSIIIGTIKTLEPKYGIKYLIKAFKIVKEKLTGHSLKLLLVGGGQQEEELKILCRQLDIQDDVVFTGFVPFEKVVNYYNILDIYVALSLDESFGVSILEACACGKPVVVSDVGGLPEVVKANVTGFIVESEDEHAAARAIETLTMDKELAKKMGTAGREWVLQKYEWKQCVKQMLSIYHQILYAKI